MGKKQTRSSKDRTPKRKSGPEVVDIPRFETTDFNDPEQHALPALVGLPHLKGAPLGMPLVMLRWISKRLWDCGYRYQPELRTIKYRPPHAGMGVGMLSSAGEWVPVDDPDPVSGEDSAFFEAREKLATLPDSQKHQIVNALGLNTEPGPGDGMVPYRRVDGSVVLVTPAQARRYANAKRARGGEEGL